MNGVIYKLFNNINEYADFTKKTKEDIYNQTKEIVKECYLGNTKQFEEDTTDLLRSDEARDILRETLDNIDTSRIKDDKLDFID